MAIPNFDAYKKERASPRWRTRYGKGTTLFQSNKNKLISLWQNAPLGGAIPSTAAVPTNATTGSLGQPNSANSARLIYATVAMGSNSFPGVSCGFAYAIVIADRLSHQGGLSGTVTTAQTTNLPTAALTRYTTGEGVMLLLEYYTAVGFGATTVTVSYTNQAGTAGQTSIATDFGGNGTAAPLGNEVVPIPLASGDTGVRAVASVTVATTTGTAGNFGVTLYKPLLSIPPYVARTYPSTVGRVALDSLLDAGGAFSQPIQTNACLWFLSIVNAQSTAGSNDGAPIFQAEIGVSED